MKLFEIKTSSIFDDEIRTYYTLEEDMTKAFEKIKGVLPYEETAFAISQKKLVEAENEKLKEEYNQAFNQGAEAAWELARKIVLKNGYSAYDLHEIFNCCGSHQALEDYTYSEVAAKVAEWERTKEEIKVGDILENIEYNKDRCVVTNLYPGNMAYLVFDDGSAGMNDLDHFKKTGRHIDIDGFLKQIGGNGNE